MMDDCIFQKSSDNKQQVNLEPYVDGLCVATAKQIPKKRKARRVKREVKIVFNILEEWNKD